MGNTKTEIERGLEARGYKLLSVLDDGLAKKGFRSLYKDGRFVVRVKLGNGKIEFNGKKYTDADTLLGTVVSYTDTLEYPTETYDPDMRDEYRDEARIEHIYKSFGFENIGRGFDGNNYVANGIVGFRYGKIVNGSTLVIDDNRWIMLYDENADPYTKYASAKSLLYAVYASNLASMLKVMKKSGQLENCLKIEVDEFDKDTLETRKKDITGELLSVLKDAVAMLEGNTGKTE